MNTNLPQIKNLMDFPDYAAVYAKVHEVEQQLSAVAAEAARISAAGGATRSIN